MFFLTTTPGLRAFIQLANIMLPGTLHVQRLDGNLTNHLSFNNLDYTGNNLSIHLNQCHVTWQITSWRHPRVTVTNLQIGTLDVAQINPVDSSPKTSLTPFNLPKIPVIVDIQSVSIDQLHIASFTADTIRLHAFFSHNQWIIHQFDANYAQVNVSLQAHGQLQKTYPLSATLRVVPLSPSTSAIQGQLTLDGDTSLYRWQGQFTGSIPITLNGTWRYLNGKNQLDSQLSWGVNTLQIIGSLADQFQINASIPKPELLHSSLKGLQTSIVAKGAINNKQQGTLSVTINPGLYQLPNESPIPSIPFQGGHLLLKLTPNDLQATGAFTLDREKIIDFAMHLPNIQLKQLARPAQVIDGTINLHINSLDFLQGLSKSIDHPHGQLLATIKATGTLGNPTVQGTLMLSNAGVSIPAIGLTLNPMQATLSSHNQQWDATGSIRAQDGQLLELKGLGTFSPQFTGELLIHGDNFPAIKTAEYTVKISPQLTFNVQPTAYTLSGTILIPTAQLKPMSFSNTVNLTDDAVFVKHESSAPPISTHMSTDIQIKMGQDVAIDVQGLHGFLDGAIQLKQVPNSSMSALGELTVRDGTYKAYGQDLNIEHGQLLFSGGTLTNPDISLRATRKFNNNTSSFSGSNQLFDFNAANLQTIDFGNHLTVGIEVSGHLNSPKIKLFSVPTSLSQADILSMLLLGKPANQASQSGGQLLLTAISSMNLDSGTKGMQLLSQLKQSLGFDFNVQSSSQFNQKTNQSSDSTAFVVGKSISKRLYLSYNIGLFQKDSNVLTLKYLLNKFFSLQVSASNAGNGLDLLYSAQP